MKTLIIFSITVFLSINLNAQTPYENGMNKAFELWNQDKLTEASNVFERIAKVENDDWLPPYYAGYTLVLSAFKNKDETTLKLNLDKATDFLNQASSISPDNPEIMIAKALANTAYISFDGQKYGMRLAPKNTNIYDKALKIAPENPRVILAKAEWDMGSARFFNQSIEPYCEDIALAIKTFEEEEKPDEKFYPNWGLERAKKILSQCKN